MEANHIHGVQELKKGLQDLGVRYALASFVDLHGINKSKVVPLAHFEQMIAGSELFTGAALDGVPQQVNDEEVSAHPDLESCTVLPWNKEVAWFASDLYLQGRPFEACSRGILKKVLNEAADMGYSLNLGIETEFFILKDEDDGAFGPASVRDNLAKPCYDVRRFLDNYVLIDEIVQAMNMLGWDVYSFDHEDANGQFETDFQYCDGLKMADRFVFFRMLVSELAHNHGYFATFMPKPFQNRTGNGAHFNISLADTKTGENLFDDPADIRGCKISKLGYQFIAGILKHASAISAVIAPTVNSYKRLVRQGSMSGFTWAPVHISYGSNNRTNMLRVPIAGGRVECRAVDMSCNPYLAAAMILSAGLEGVRDNLDPGDPHRENMYIYTEEELKSRDVTYLPRTLGEAIDSFDRDPLGEKVMGPLMARTYAEFKRTEWLDYHNHVSEWEIQRYLKFF